MLVRCWFKRNCLLAGKRLDVPDLPVGSVKHMIVQVNVQGECSVKLPECSVMYIMSVIDNFLLPLNIDYLKLFYKMLQHKLHAGLGDE